MVEHKNISSKNDFVVECQKCKCKKIKIEMQIQWYDTNVYLVCNHCGLKKEIYSHSDR